MNARLSGASMGMNSMSVGSIGWAQLSEFASNTRPGVGLAEALNDEELDPEDLELADSDDDNLNAFGVTTPSKSGANSRMDFECEEEDDGAAAFGAFDSD